LLALTRTDVQRLVPMRDAIELMKNVFAELSAGRVFSPLRTVIEIDPNRAQTLLMPAYVPSRAALGVKIVSVFRANPARGLPTINAIVCAIDTETGEPLAIMDGTYLTALRTGAVSGAATDLLARPESRVLVVVGGGAQGVTQAAAVCAVRPIERIIVVDPDPAAHERFARDVERDWPNLGQRLEFAELAARVVSEADVICTATTSRQPVFADTDVQRGTHINAIGAFTPEMQEVPAATVVRATVVVDSVEAALAEAGDLIIPLREGQVGREHFARELGAIVAGDAPGRRDADEITLFKSVGNAVQDVIVARHAVDRARAAGMGMTLDLG